MIKKMAASPFIRNVVAYSSANLVDQSITMVRGFVIRRLLPPEIMGFWNFVSVIQGVLGIFDFGGISGASRELPVAAGKGDSEDALKIRSAAFWFTVIQNFVVGSVALIYIYFIKKTDYLPWQTTAAYAGVVIFFLGTIQSLYSTFYSGAQQFVALSRIMLAASILDGVAFPLCTYLWGLGGLIAMSIVSTLIRASLFFFSGWVTGFRVRCRIYGNTLKRILSFGFSLRVVDYPYGVFQMVDILWVTRFLGLEALALFSLAKAFSMQVIDVTNKTGTVYAMRFLEQTGRKVSKESLAVQMKQYIIFQLLVMVPLLSWAAFVFLPFVVDRFIPKYSPSNKTFLIFLVSGFFYVINSGLTNPWVAEKKLVRRGTANLFGLAVMTASVSVQWYVLGNRSISGIAYASITGQYLYFVYMVFAVGKEYWTYLECLEVVLSVTAGALWAYLVISFGYAHIARDVDFVKHLLSTVQTGIVTFLALLPVVIYGFRRSRVLKGWS